MAIGVKKARLAARATTSQPTMGRVNLPSSVESRPGSAGYADSIRDRVLRMLIGDGERPRRSGLDGIPGSCTNRLVVAARRVVRELWEAHEDDIRRSCSPHLPTSLIDEMDVLAYVLADALGRPNDTNKFGKKVAMQAARVEARLVDAERQADGAVRKAAAAAAANPSLLPRVQAARDARAVATDKILNAPYDPKPPDRTVGAKRKIDETIPLRGVQRQRFAQRSSRYGGPGRSSTSWVRCPPWICRRIWTTKQARPLLGVGGSASERCASARCRLSPLPSSMRSRR
jgi:hypothetical protein